MTRLWGTLALGWLWCRCLWRCHTGRGCLVAGLVVGGRWDALDSLAYNVAVAAQEARNDET